MSDLTNRLRCKYPSGPIIDGEPEFGWRDMSGPAPEGMTLPTSIMIEAADRIEELEAMLGKKLDLIKCGIGANYSGNPYENNLYIEALKVYRGVK